MQIAAQVAFEVMAASGARTGSRLRSLVVAYAKTYGITGGEALEALHAEALAAAARLFDFNPDA